MEALGLTVAIGQLGVLWRRDCSQAVKEVTKAHE